METAAARNWYGVEDLLRIRGGSVRSLRRELADLPESVRRKEEAEGPGRPRLLYHYTALPWLRVRHEGHGAECIEHGARGTGQRAEGRRQSAEGMAHGARGMGQRAEGRRQSAEGMAHGVGGTGQRTEGKGPAPEDLAIAQLRLTAIEECNVRTPVMGRQEAMRATCEDWSRRLPDQVVSTVERLPDGHRRTAERRVCLGVFRPRTLSRWISIYRKEGNLLALVPAWKGTRGRKEVPVPGALMDLVWTLSASTARADVAKAVEYAKREWPGEFPKLSISGWRRRVKKMDPRGAAKDLMHSVARFRANQTGDVERDWSELEYNGLWQIDDVQEDWFAWSSNLQRMLRPYAYAILRVSTRKWVAMVTAETPITQEQIRTLVGCAMVSPAGGIPGEIKFERGTVATDPHLDWLLSTLGVRVGRTSMDGGSVVPGAPADRATGHWQGKAMVEANFRRGHNLAWAMPTQVGPEHKHTAPMRLETLLQEEAARLATEGKMAVVPADGEWHRICAEIREKHNNTPHSGLPTIVDPADGKQRHMTPNEAEKWKAAESVRVMDAKYLPLFYVKGERVDVTRNGIRLGNACFGRFDEDLKRHETVLAYAAPQFAEFAYVHELGRCVERYEKESLDGEGEQIGKKKRDEKAFRSRYEAAMANAIGSGAAGPVMVDMVRILTDPVPARQRQTVTVAALDERAGAMMAARERFAARRMELDDRFRIPGEEAAPAAGRRPGRRGLLARAEEMEAAVAAMGGGA